MRTIPLKESLNVEFKSDKNLLPDAELIDAVVGMTNAKGGTLFLGVEDDGKITGVHPKHADEIGVVALIANKTRPSITVQAELVREESYPVLRIQVPMSSKFVVASSDGKVLQRRLKLNGTPENSPIYPYEINSRLSELSLLDFSAQILPGAER
ncbi:MAG: ATP-binding protein, partial [Verrucomicrobia bacterium]|nr:ATP-binding protein [Verrucomicrobiota bacterium]